VYKPSIPVALAKKASSSSDPRTIAEQKAREIMASLGGSVGGDESREVRAAPPARPKPSRPANARLANLHSFKEELKMWVHACGIFLNCVHRIQAARDQRKDLVKSMGIDPATAGAAVAGLDNAYAMGCYDEDPLTTNLFVGNLAQTVWSPKRLPIMDYCGLGYTRRPVRVVWPVRPTC
jgi:hypothetical protein